MTKEQFDDYDFSIYTEIQSNGESRWERITSVDFVRRVIETNYHGPVMVERVEGIRN